MLPLTIIVAATKNNGIGKNSRLPWRLSKDLRYFAQATSNAPEGKRNAVIMGRSTWESIPPNFRPLPNRLNIVLSRQQDYDLGVPDGAPACLFYDLKSAFSHIETLHKENKIPIHRTFIIGGATVYKETLDLPSIGQEFVNRVLLTRISEPDFDCDVFMPDIFQEKERWKRAPHEELQKWVGFDVVRGVQEENGIKYEFQMWTREA
ncbi:hypothetical protein AMATHDRAFT_134370 [Amanita thiersii Skay4041]|uniref:Dihydrofolate reductase n=1 Tax=Amanita thiersii Skay4041 TaxID=703135 RepID=A0A2A9NY26_9AGAR|nr:hypothetical protein AMATHDRAFT_134370 [Amanita thiersii Skay4041]